MASFYKSYCASVKKDTGYFACWLPTQQFALGDYGTVKENNFIRIGNIADLGIDLHPQEKKSNPLTFQSSDVTIAHVAAKATAGPAKKGAKGAFTINLQKANSYYLHFVDCSIAKVKNYTQVGESVLELRERSGWKDSWHVITELVGVKRSLIYIAKQSGSQVTINLSSGTQASFLQKLDATMSIKSSKQLGFQSFGKELITPLFRLSKVFSPALMIKPTSFRTLSEPNRTSKTDTRSFFLFEDIYKHPNP
ncbi:MAG: hypothetical protein V4557_12410 [Bacteroidota bacterium]